MLPKPKMKTKGRMTQIFWVIEDSEIPPVDELRSVENNCALHLFEAGYRGGSDLFVYIVDRDTELSPKQLELVMRRLEKKDFFVYGGGEGNPDMKFNHFLLDFLSWTISHSHPGEEINLLILIKNEDYLGPDTKFATVRETLERRGFAVGVAHPDTFKDLDRSGSSQKAEEQIGVSKNSPRHCQEHKIKKKMQGSITRASGLSHQNDTEAEKSSCQRSPSKLSKPASQDKFTEPQSEGSSRTSKVINLSNRWSRRVKPQVK